MHLILVFTFCDIRMSTPCVRENFFHKAWSTSLSRAEIIQGKGRKDPRTLAWERPEGERNLAGKGSSTTNNSHNQNKLTSFSQKIQEWIVR